MAFRASSLITAGRRALGLISPSEQFNTAVAARDLAKIITLALNHDEITEGHLLAVLQSIPPANKAQALYTATETLLKEINSSNAIKATIILNCFKHIGTDFSERRGLRHIDIILQTSAFTEPQQKLLKQFRTIKKEQISSQLTPLLQETHASYAATRRTAPSRGIRSSALPSLDPAPLSARSHVPLHGRRAPAPEFTTPVRRALREISNTTPSTGETSNSTPSTQRTGDPK